jgi:hypothetical protein
MARLLCSLLITAILASGILPSTGMGLDLVLCLEVGGHLAIEPAHEVPDCASLCHGDHAEPEAVAHERHTCVDLALSGLDPVVRRTPSRLASVVQSGWAQMLPPASPSLDWPGRRVAPSVRYPLAALPPPALRAVRTVILQT